MSWKYYRNGKLIQECDDLPETMEDAVTELEANGHDVSDCVIEPESDLELYLSGTGDDDDIAFCDDNWSPDYPPEEEEYKDTLTFKPLTDEDIVELKKVRKILREMLPVKAPEGFMGRLQERIYQEHKSTWYKRLRLWCLQWYYRIFK